MSGLQAIQRAGDVSLDAILRDEARCRALLAATDAIVWTIHPEDGFVEPQPSWQAYTGQSWEEARGHGWRNAVHPDDLPDVLEAWSHAVHHADRYHAPCRVWHAASREHRQCMVRAAAIRDADGRVVEWVGAVTDVHDRPLNLPELHRLNDALKHQLEAHHEELERLFSVSLDVMLTLGADGRLMTLSPSFEAVTGVPPAEARGQVFERFLHPDDVQRTWDEVRRVLTGRHNSIDFETRVLRADGGVRIVSWRTVGSASESRLYAVGRDITETKRAEQRMMRAQRLEAVGQLTGGIAHDFNNILGAMLSFIEVAKRQSGDPQKQARTLESAMAAGRRGATLVRQLLTFARKQELALQPTDVNRLAREMRDLLVRTLGGTVELKFDLAPALAPALADPTQLEAVLLNLCINARDAMPDGGCLTIRTAPHAITGDTSTRRDDLPVGDYVLLIVRDEGLGMNEATLARCFEPFFTTKEPGYGTGLGLPQVLGVVQQCGGMVKLESAPGQGTTVEVVLPRAKGDAAHAGPAIGASPPSLAAGTVLVVDDNPDVLAATVELLTSFGFDAIPAAGAEEAMSIVLSARPFDVLLTDHAMPGMTGAQLLKDAVRHRPQLVGMIVTGYADVSSVREMVPGVAVLRKPFEADQLAEAVEAAVSAHRLQTGEH